MDWLSKTFAIPKPGDDEETLEAPEVPYSDRTLERQKEFYKYRKTYGAEKQPQVSDPVTSGEGVWRTINGVHVFIEDGQSVEDAIAEMKRVSEGNKDKLKQEKGLEKTPKNDKLEPSSDKKNEQSELKKQSGGEAEELRRKDEGDDVRLSVDSLRSSPASRQIESAAYQLRGSSLANPAHDERLDVRKRMVEEETHALRKWAEENGKLGGKLPPEDVRGGEHTVSLENAKKTGRVEKATILSDNHFGYGIAYGSYAQGI